MVDEPNWSKLIKYLYNDETGRVMVPTYITEEDKLNEDHPFIEDLSWEQGNPSDALFQAVEFGFLEVRHFSGTHFDSQELSFDMFKDSRPPFEPKQEFSLGLSEKGFDVAHEREQLNLQEKHRSYQNFNQTITTLFTVFLGTGILTQTLLMLLGRSLSVQIGISFFMVFIFAAIYWQMQKYLGRMDL